MLEHIKLYWKLTRNDRPIGWFLLFIPCLWIVLFLYSNVYIVYIDNFSIGKLLFVMLIGSILTRSAFCVWNDYADIDFDKQVMRTKNRPIANGNVSKKSAIGIMVFIFSVGIWLLFYFSKPVMGIVLFSLVLSLIYPFVKRFSNLAQFWLGLTFNMVVFIAGVQFLLNIDGFEFNFYDTYVNFSFNPIVMFFVFYIVGVIWTIIYDTIYAFQDIECDKKCGVKSTAILFEKNYKIVLSALCVIKFLFFVYICSFYNFEVRNHLIFNNVELFNLGKFLSSFVLGLILIGELKIIQNVKFGDLASGSKNFNKHGLYGFITGVLLIL